MADEPKQSPDKKDVNVDVDRKDELGQSDDEAKTYNTVEGAEIKQNASSDSKKLNETWKVDEGHNESSAERRPLQDSEGLNPETASVNDQQVEGPIVLKSEQSSSYESGTTAEIDTTSDTVSVDLNSFNNHGPSEEGESVTKVEHKGSKVFEKTGWLRHYVAIAALLGIVLANLNRQAFNQALVKMVCKSKISKNVVSTTMTPELPSTVDSIMTTSPFLTTLAPTTTTLGYVTIHPKEPLPVTHTYETTTKFTTQELTTMYMTEAPTSQIIKTPEYMTSSTTTSGPTITTQGSESMTISYKTVESEQAFGSKGGLYDPDLDCFAWDSEQISILQAAFSYGYTPLMIFSARISELYGAKWIIFTSSFGSALCCFLSPYFATTAMGFNLLVLSRVLMGLSQTGVSPALYAIVVRWLPLEESSVYLPMMKVSCTLGFTLGSVIAGSLSWRMTFYTVSAIGFLWCLVWPFTVESDPNESRLISRNEFNYIRQEMRKRTQNRKESVATARKRAAPWIPIFTHPVVLAFMFTKLTVKMSTDAQTQQLGMYLKSIFDISDFANGLLNGSNYALQAALTGLVAYAAKECVSRKIFGFSKTQVRRMFQGIANFGMALAFISITFNMGSITMVCISYFLLSIASMFVAGGESVIPVDLSTDYAATIMSIANFTANLSGIILPQIVAQILGSERNNLERWNMIWLFMSVVQASGGTLFCLVARAELLDFEKSKLVLLYEHITKKNREPGNKTAENGAIKGKSVTIQMNDLNSKPK